MGYIFDALSRAMDDEPQKQPNESAAKPSDVVDALEAAQPAAPEPEAGSPEPKQPTLADAMDQLQTVEEQVAEVEAQVEAFDSVDDTTPDDDDEPAAVVGSLPAPTNRIAAEVANLDKGKMAAATIHEPTPDWIQQIDDRLVSLADPCALLAEEYRSIRTSLLARCEKGRSYVHTITSATPQEGKTITSLNLGLSLAELRNRRTLVIEADLRLPTFEKLLKLNHTQGLIQHLRDGVPLEECMVRIGDAGLHVVTAGGRANTDAVQLLSSQAMANLVDQLRGHFDQIIIDTPPVVELADAGILGALSDDVMLIARMDRTPRRLIEQAIRTLASYHAPVAGVIATDHKRLRDRTYYRYGYRYRYRYAYTDSRKRAA